MLGISCVWLVLAIAGVTQGADVALSNIPDVIYPPVAQAAMVSGDIHIQVEVRPDGSVAWASVLEPRARFDQLLAPSALDAARKASFTCRGCTEPLTSHLLMFAFELRGAEKTRTIVETATPGRTRIRVIADIPICDHCGGGGTHQIQRTRTIKCLWLWRCGL